MVIEKLTVDPSSHKSLMAYVKRKFELFSNDNKDFETLYKYMFYDRDNIMIETTDGYRIKKTTYQEFKTRIDYTASSLHELIELPKGSTVGLHLENCPEWIELFWSILSAGYNPLLFNSHLGEDILNGIIKEYDIKLVISNNENYPCKKLNIHDIFEYKNKQNVSKEWGTTVFFMSSGTSTSVKLCAYGAENFYYQISTSLDVVSSCPQMAKHYEGSLKQLMLLPLYHVYGFIAVYLWFGFYSRTFVFLKDLKPDTIQKTILKHKITHFFIVPLVLETIYKKAIKRIKQKGTKTYDKFMKGLKIANSSSIGYHLVYPKMKEVREQLFGDSIQFLISGGGYLKSEVSSFFNGIGYTLANGFGMSEVGITSVETSAKAKERIKSSVGKPFGCTEYKISDEGELLIRGKNMAKCIYQGDKTFVTDYDEFFNTKDLAMVKEDKYYLLGRKDDLVISSTGENLNPLLIENSLMVEGIDDIALVGINSKPTLIVYSSKVYDFVTTNKIKDIIIQRLHQTNIDNEIKDIIITSTSLVEPSEVKKSRKHIANRFLNNEFKQYKENLVLDSSTQNDDIMKSLFDIFNSILDKEYEIKECDHFFLDLGGTSIEYLLLADSIYDKFELDIRDVNGSSLYTIKDIYINIIYKS